MYTFIICVTSRGERYILRGIVVKHRDMELKHGNFLIALNDLKKQMKKHTCLPASRFVFDRWT